MEPAIKKQSVIRFSDLELDQHAGELRKDGARSVQKLDCQVATGN
jgi:hypothetical protein